MSNFRFTQQSNFPPIIKNLIIINVLVAVAQLMLDQRFQLTNLFTLDPIISDQLKAAMEQNAPEVGLPHFVPYQVFTYMFTHAPLLEMPFHILFNMLILWMFGRILENIWGAKRFLTFYLICGVGAAIFHLLIQFIRSEFFLLPAVQHLDQIAFNRYAGSLAGMVGASGAIMGVTAAYAYLFPNTELYVYGVFPIKAKWLVLGYFAIDLFGGINPKMGDNVAHFAHLGGAITGFIIVFIWNKTNRKTLY